MPNANNPVFKIDAVNRWLTYELVKDFQTAIVGVIGFGGIMFTQYLNARSARQLAAAERSSTALTIKRAVLVELKFFRKTIAQNAEARAPEPGAYAHLPRLARPMTSPLMGKLGLLPEQILDD